MESLETLIKFRDHVVILPFPFTILHSSPLKYNPQKFSVFTSNFPQVQNG